MNNPYYEKVRPEVAPFLPQIPAGARLLEIGCAAGHFRENIKQSCVYWGIEPVPEVAKLAEQRLDKVLCGTYEAVADSLPENYFDVVICNDAIEHMQSTDEFLASIKGKLSANGVLVGSIPNVRFFRNLYNLLVRKDWKYESEGILDRTHLRFFTERSLKRTLEANNYVLEAQGRINPQRFSHRTPKSVMGACMLGICSVLLGGDIKYPQFGFRAAPVRSQSGLVDNTIRACEHSKRT